MVTLSLIFSAVAVLIGTITVLRSTPRDRRRKARHLSSRAATLNRQIAQSEAALGLPVVLDPTQTCPVCGTTRVLGASYCQQCAYEWVPPTITLHPLLCPACDKRIPENSRLCPFCRATITKDVRLWNDGQISIPLRLAPTEWRCRLCGTEFFFNHTQPYVSGDSSTLHPLCETCGSILDWAKIPGTLPPPKYSYLPLPLDTTPDPDWPRDTDEEDDGFDDYAAPAKRKPNRTPPQHPSVVQPPPAQRSLLTKDQLDALLEPTSKQVNAALSAITKHQQMVAAANAVSQPPKKRVGTYAREWRDQQVYAAKCVECTSRNLFGEKTCRHCGNFLNWEN